MHDLGQVPGRPTDFDEILLPAGVERQQPLADRFVERPRLWAVMENIKPRIFVLVPTFERLVLSLMQQFLGIPVTKDQGIGLLMDELVEDNSALFFPSFKSSLSRGHNAASGIGGHWVNIS